MIDGHCHLGPGLRAKAPFGPLYEGDTPEKLLGLLDRVGIQKAVVCAPTWQGGWNGEDFLDPGYEAANAAIAEAVRKYPDRLIGFGRVNPKFGGAAVRELERCFKAYGLKGLKLNNEGDGFEGTDMRLVGPLAQVCRQYRAPIFVHTGFHPCEPLLFLPLAQAFPDVNIILGHMGGRIAIDAVITAQHSPNIYLETSGETPGNIRNAVRAVGAGRVIFGTDLPYNIPEVEVRRINSIDLTEEDLRRITQENIASLLGLGA